jgi:hypothetical protein
MNEYEQQAIDFAKKVGLTMETLYLGHYKRLSDRVTAQYRVALKRGNREYRFDFSTSINDSWKFFKQEESKRLKGLPSGIDIDEFFDSQTCLQESFTYRQFYVSRAKKAPSLCDILACLTKYDPGSHEEFCDNYGYDQDSIKGLNTYLEVQKEWREVNRMFGDVLDELSEIN